MIKHVKVVTWTGLLILIFSKACQKAEFQRPEHGEAVPYVDSIDVTIAELLRNPEYGLFKQMWDRADLGNVLREGGTSKDQYTLFVPSDGAWIDAGWTEQRIHDTTPEELEQILQLHVVRTNLIHLIDAPRSGNVVIPTLYQHPTLKYTAYLHPYIHKIAVGWEDDRLFINGKNIGVKLPQPAIDGCLWQINEVLAPPVQTAWEALKGDPRFSIYTGLLERTDLEYAEIFKEANGYYPDVENDTERPYARHTPDRLGMMIRQTFNGELYVTDLNTYFIPTDDAFRAAGFATVDDLFMYNRERGYPTVTWQDPLGTNDSGFYRVVGEFATDSLLDYHHNWGLRFADARFQRDGHRNLFFTNDLHNDVINSYPIASFNRRYFTGQGALIRAETTYYKMPFTFSNAGIKILHGGGSAEWTEDNMLTFNGVIHGVKKLLVPIGF